MADMMSGMMMAQGREVLALRVAEEELRHRAAGPRPTKAGRARVRTLAGREGKRAGRQKG